MIRRRFVQNLSLLLLLGGLMIVPATTSAASKSNGVISARKTCEQQANIVNYRSTLLKTYKDTQDKRYQRNYNQWATRIRYAGQWVPNDARKARENLYKYRQLHKTMLNEIDRQIQAYQYLETSPLDCSAASKDALAKKVAEVHGVKNKKAVSGNALINKYQNQEVAFANKDMQKSNQKMIKNLHKEKRKHPTPEFSKTAVDTE
jgi:hypothetical protein